MTACTCAPNEFGIAACDLPAHCEHASQTGVDGVGWVCDSCDDVSSALCRPCTDGRHADPVREHWLASGPRCSCSCSSTRTTERCGKCLNTGWRLLPTVAPTHAVPCDRCDAPQMTDMHAVEAAHLTSSGPSSQVATSPGLSTRVQRDVRVMPGGSTEGRAGRSADAPSPPPDVGHGASGT